MASGAIELPEPSLFDPSAIPEDATLLRGGTALRLTWRDGISAVLPAERLRLRCRCAWCTRDRLESRFPQAFPDLAVVGVDHMGGYAVHIAFSDGHARGIFPWTYLRALAAEAAEIRPVTPQAA